jgi:short-subunit dehydrogenase
VRGPIDILVDNAGVGSYREREIWNQDPAVWREPMTVNLDAPFELTRLIAGGMIHRRWGRIVMVCSTASLAAGVAPGMTAYTGCSGSPGRWRSTSLHLA